MIRSRETAPHHTWREGCKGWRRCDTPELCVMRETMPPDAAEERHRHAAVCQVFPVLSGTLTMGLDGIEHRMAPMRPSKCHRARRIRQ